MRAHRRQNRRGGAQGGVRLLVAGVDEEGQDDALEDEGDEDPDDGVLAGEGGELPIVGGFEGGFGGEEGEDAGAEGQEGKALDDEGAEFGLGEFGSELGVTILLAELDEELLEMAFEAGGADGIVDGIFGF